VLLAEANRPAAEGERRYTWAWVATTAPAITC
jgi:hypothetical protein